MATCDMINYLRKWKLRQSNGNLNEIIPILSMMLGAITISFSAVYVKLVDVTPSVSAFYRMFFGAIMLLFIVVIQKKRYWHSGLYFTFTFIGGLAIALNMVMWHMSILYIGPGLATILGNFQVFMMALFGFFIFKEKLKIRFIFSIFLAFFGLFLMIGTNWDQASEYYQLGIYLGFVVAVCYATYLLFLRVVQTMNSPLSSVTNLFIMTAISALILFIIAVFRQESLSIPNFRNFVYLMCYGFFSQVIGWVIIAWSMPRIKASLAGFILLMQPALTFVWDVLFFDRLLNWVIASGIFITLAAIYMGTSGGSHSSKH
ncbi:MAG: DMT family transporter [Deltaproteobacteria bacterium]|jgi:drug/metabolite transporter (DMT)-like permease|nr:DMT family transporter [Deltaproteobacteria bacterium]MBT4528103.1 DMT family transporter [Deltaproteobacteria bacterium]